MMQDVWNAPPGFRPTKSAPSSPAKPLAISRTRSESFHAIHKVPVGDSPYVRAKNVQLVEKDPERAIPLFWAAINAGDRVDSALKDMAVVMKQQNRAEEAIEAIKSLRRRCTDQAQESLDNILLDLYKRCGRLEDQITLLKRKLFLIQQGLAFNGKKNENSAISGEEVSDFSGARSNSVTGWALMQQNNYIEAEDAYRRALSISLDNNKMCNLGICLMKQGRIGEAKQNLRQVRPAVVDGPRGGDSHLKAYERAQQMLKDLESEMMSKGGGDRVEQSRLFDVFLGKSSIWQPQPCKDHSAAIPVARIQDEFADENADANTVAISEQKTVNVKHGPFGNALSKDAPPFYSSKFNETLKRTRSGNAANAMRLNDCAKSFVAEPEKPEIKARKISLPEKSGNELDSFLPDNKDFEEAIIAAVLGSTNEEVNSVGILQKKVEKQRRLRVFQDITLSLSPRA